MPRPSAGIVLCMSNHLLAAGLISLVLIAATTVSGSATAQTHAQTHARVA